MFCGLAALSMQTFFLQDDSNSFQDCYIPLLCRFKCFHVCHRIQLQTRDVPTSNFLYRKPRDTARLVGGFWGNISLNSRRVLTCDLPENSCITTRLFPASNVKCCMPSLTPTASPSTVVNCNNLPVSSKKVQSQDCCSLAHICALSRLAAACTGHTWEVAEDAAAGSWRFGAQFHAGWLSHLVSQARAHRWDS